MSIPAKKKVVLFAWACLALTLALVLRVRAANRLLVDYDEPVYLPAAQHYAQAIALGDWNELSAYRFNIEHPVFYKLIYGVVFSNLQDSQVSLDLQWWKPAPDGAMGRLLQAGSHRRLLEGWRSSCWRC